MMVKRVLIFSAIFITVLIAVSIYVINSIALNDVFKRFIISQAYYKYNLKVEINDLSFSYFYPSVTVSGFSLEKKTDDYHFYLQSKDVKLAFRFLQLFSGKIIVSSVDVNTPDVFLKANNLSSVMKDFQSNNTESKDTLEIILNNLFNIEIEQIKIINSKIDINIKQDPWLVVDKTNIEIKKGKFLNYIIDLNVPAFSTSYGYLTDLKLLVDIRKKILKIKDLNFILDGESISIYGDVHNYINPLKAKLNLEWELTANLNKFKTYFSLLNLNIQEFPEGTLFSKGVFTYDTSKDFSTALFKSEFKINNLKYDIIFLPYLSGIATYSNNKVAIKQLDLSDGNNSATIYDTNIELQGLFPISGKLKTQELELSRYLEIFNIKNCLSYTNVVSNLTFDGYLLPEPNISVLIDIAVKDFWVLLTKKSKLNKDNSIINFQKGNIEGLMQINSKGVYFDNVLAKSEDNNLSVEGWITKDSTVDLNVISNSFSVDTYGRINTLPVKGNGVLKANLIVDEAGSFKAKGGISFKNIEIDGYLLGDVNSDFVYDSFLLSFSNIKSKLRTSTYSGQLVLDLNDILNLSGSVLFDDTYIEDLYKVFKIDEKNSLLPTGVLKGNLEFKGEADWNKIQIVSNLKLKDIEFLSEIYEEVLFRFTWLNGDLNVREAYIKKGKGLLNILASRKNKKLDIKIDSKDITTHDFSLFINNNDSFLGKMNFKAEIENYNSITKGYISLNIKDIYIDNKSVAPIFLNLDIGDNFLLSYDFFNKQITGSINKEEKDYYLLKANFKDFNAYNLSSVFFKNNKIFKTNIDGYLDIKFNFKGDVELLKMSFDELNYNSNNFFIQNKSKVHLLYANEIYSVTPFTISSSRDTIQCDLNVSGGESNVAVKGCMLADVCTVFNNYVSNSKGKFNIDLNYSKKLNGLINIDQLELVPEWQKIGTINSNGNIYIKNDIANLDILKFTLGGGDIAFGGEIELDKVLKFKTFYPILNLKADIDKVSFEYPDGLRGKWSGFLNIIGDGFLPYKITGNLNFFDASYRKDHNLDQIKLNTNLKYSFLSGIFLNKKNFLDFNIKFKSDISNLLVKNNIFDGELKFDLVLKGSELLPYMEGDIFVLNGDLTYRDIVFNITSGRVKFTGESDQSYNYQLDAETEISTYKIMLHVLGDKTDFNIRLSSLPSLNEDEIISLMATGEARTELTTREKQYNMTVGEGSKIVTGGLGVTGAIQENTGVNVKLKYSPKNDSTLPEIEVKKNLTDNIKLIYGKSLNEEVNKQEINIKYEINKNIELDLLLEEDQGDKFEEKPSKAGFDLRFKFEF